MVVFAVSLFFFSVHFLFPFSSSHGEIRKEHQEGEPDLELKHGPSLRKVFLHTFCRESPLVWNSQRFLMKFHLRKDLIEKHV